MALVAVWDQQLVTAFRWVKLLPTWLPRVAEEARHKTLTVEVIKSQALCSVLSQLEEALTPGKMAAKAPVEAFSATFADRAGASELQAGSEWCWGSHATRWLVPISYKLYGICRSLTWMFGHAQVAGALWGMHIADAIAMPTHWYYGGEHSR